MSVATHKPNVYIDLSGWSPKYFPPILVRYINSILQDKMLFGSDWPVITPGPLVIGFRQARHSRRDQAKSAKSKRAKDPEHLTAWVRARRQQQKKEQP